MKTYFASILLATMATPVGCLVAFVYFNHVWQATIPAAATAGAYAVGLFLFLSASLFAVARKVSNRSNGSAS